MSLAGSELERGGVSEMVGGTSSGWDICVRDLAAEFLVGLGERSKCFLGLESRSVCPVWV